jgi:hypothetical protein
MQPVNQDYSVCRLSPKPSTVRRAYTPRAAMAEMSSQPFYFGFSMDETRGTFVWLRGASTAMQLNTDGGSSDRTDHRRQKLR